MTEDISYEQEQWSWLSALAVLAVAGSCSVCASTLSTYQIIQHLRYYAEPVFQRYIVRIIFLVPMYALLSFFSLIFNQTANMWFDTIRDVYEAWVLYNFLNLCIEYAGGPGEIVKAAEGQTIKSSVLTCTCCIPSLEVTGKFIRRCKIATIQFVYLKPVLAILILILYAFGEYEEGNFALNQGYLYIQIVYNVSYTSALYGLLLFYLGTEEILASFNPLIKFLLIKLVIFFTYWQGLFLSILGFMEIIPTSQDAKGLQNFMICVQMVASAICMWFAFPFNEYKTAYNRQNQRIKSYGGAIGHAISIKDLVSDTVHQFAPVYREYVLYSDGSRANDEGGQNNQDNNKKTRKIKTKTFVMLGRESMIAHSSDQGNLLANMDGTGVSSENAKEVELVDVEKAEQKSDGDGSKGQDPGSSRSSNSASSNSPSDWQQIDLGI